MNKKKFSPYILIAPVVIFMLLVYGYPLFLTLKYSFFDASLIGDNNVFIGIKNYTSILKDKEFYDTFILTVKWTVLTVGFKIGIGFLIAMILNAKIYMKKAYRFLILIPWAIPQVVVSIIWSWILDGRYGYLNYYLQNFGIIEKPLSWLTETNLAFLSTSFVDAWVGIPLVVMMFLAGLSSIPDSLYEAAKVDGANRIQRFFNVTIPSMKKVIIIVFTLTTIWTFNSFNIIFVLTGGGPIGATETLMLKIYREAFGNYDLGVSSTLSIIVFIVLTIMSVIYWRQLEKED